MDYWRKLEWAEEHAKAFDKAVHVFLDTHPCVVRGGFNSELNTNVLFIDEVTDPPVDLSLVLGDILHNVRSALDAFVYFLACRNLGRPLSDAEAIATQFVIVDDPKHWAKARDRHLRSLSEDARVLIHKLQPASRPNRSKTHGLSVLRDLANIDKHRHIVLTLAHVSSTELEFSIPEVPPGTTLTGFPGPVKKGTILAAWNFIQPDGVPVRPVDVSKQQAKINLGFDIQFAHAPPTPAGGSISLFAKEMIAYVRNEVFTPLEKALHIHE